MPAKLPITLEPRKTPRQARSEATVDAIFGATIQVLRSGGARQLTTTRVAKRAGVSVGSMYQYFPHKEALLYAVIARYLQEVAEEVDRTCAQNVGGPIEIASDALVSAYVGAKTGEIETSRALYLASADLDVADLVTTTFGRFRQAAGRMLASAPDARSRDIDRVAFNLLATLTGATRVAVESGIEPDEVASFRQQMMLLCRTCLSAARS